MERLFHHRMPQFQVFISQDKIIASLTLPCSTRSKTLLESSTLTLKTVTNTATLSRMQFNLNTHVCQPGCKILITINILDFIKFSLKRNICKTLKTSLKINELNFKFNQKLKFNCVSFYYFIFKFYSLF